MYGIPPHSPYPLHPSPPVRVVFDIAGVRGGRSIVIVAVRLSEWTIGSRNIDSDSEGSNGEVRRAAAS